MARRMTWLSVVVLLTLLTASALAEAVDYTSEDAWAYWAEGADRPADLFIVCPTVDMGKAGNLNMSMEDDATKAAFVGALNMELGIYDHAATVYAPFYRQVTFPVYSLSAEEAAPCFALAYEDVRAAFQQYLSVSADRPLVLAGFSQGSDMVLRLMREFFGDAALQDRLVAAYCIGWRVTEEDLAAYPHLRMAQGAEDTGVIVSFNTEAVDVTDSLLVPAGVKTLGINPLNWRTDSTPADASENPGACFTDYSGAITLEEPALTGAYLDPDRGTLKAADIIPADYANSLFPDGVYHLFDYQFFYRSLQQNVADRVSSYMLALENAA